jgi:chromosome segregation protein
LIYLNKLTLHNFKSFRHTTINLSKGFNCIVGPNGSGKSSICDALLFVLGETSLRRLRVQNSTDLINYMAKPNPEDKTKNAYVTLNIGGGKDVLEVAKMIKSNSKIAYRLNGKRSDRQTLISSLTANKSNVDETNTITQGEVAKVQDLNPKERRELIDIAAGIKEFNDKKDSSMKELGKVEEKIGQAKVMLNERMGFLNELGKEKKDAERYIELTTSIKAMNYTILKLKEGQITSEYQRSTDHALNKGKQSRETEAAIKSLSLKVEQLNAEREGISKNLNDRSLEIKSTNHMLDELGKDIAVKASQLSSLQERTKEIKEREGQLKDEISKITSRMQNISDEGEALKAGIMERTAKLQAMPEYKYIDGAQDNTALAKEYEEKQAKQSLLSKELDALSKQEAANVAEAEGLGKRLNELDSEMGSFRAAAESSKKTIGKAMDELAELEKAIKKDRTQLEKERADSEKKRKEMEQLDGEMLKVRETIALNGGQDKILNALSSSIKKGFFGRVEDLFTCDEKYNLAVQAAAGGRMGYFVVDSVDIAKDAISTLKTKGLGRATFIPLDEIVLPGRNAAPKKAKALLDLVSFDKEYQKAMAYVFANTYLVETVDAAKQAGFGTFRFVTMEGELIEPSGTITGGTLKSVPRIRLLESSLEKMKTEREVLVKGLAEFEQSSSALRKRIAEIDTNCFDKRIALGQLNSQVAAAEERLQELGKAKEATAKRLGALDQSIKEVKTSISSTSKESMILQSECAGLYGIISSALSGRGRQKKNTERIEQAKALEKEIKEMEIQHASIVKENEIMAQRMNELRNDMTHNSDTLKDSVAKSKELTSSISQLEKRRTDLQEAMKSHDTKSTALYQQLTKIDDQISKLSFERGKLSSELDRLSKDLLINESTRGQLQTRLNDIKAELLSYTDVQAVEEKNVGKLDERLAVAKAEVNSLGNVNLKAPEVFETRSKEADEAKEKLTTLENEKSSIINMIAEIDSKKLGVFNETLGTVTRNFEKLYGYIFDGSAKLQLSNPKDPFNSGLMVYVNRKGMNNKSADSMSGGEKSLIALMLVFAIQMRNPRSFYIMDEIDAALDKENTKKLSKLIKELSASSQFVVVSHNDTMIAAADTAIGVANKEGESKVVGIQLTHAQKTI